MTALTGVPSLDDLAADPAKAAGLPPDVARALWARCCLVQTALWPALAAPANGHEPAEAEDRLLDVKEAAERLSVSEDYLYRRARKLPFVVLLPGRLLRFSARRLEQYIRSHTGR